METDSEKYIAGKIVMQVFAKETIWKHIVSVHEGEKHSNAKIVQVSSL